MTKIVKTCQVLTPKRELLNQVLKSLGQQVMITFIDIYGKGYREIKTPADFRGG